MEWLTKADEYTPKTFVTALVARVEEFERGVDQADDITALALHLRPRG